MGCCCGKKESDDPLLKEKGSIDYDYLSTNIDFSWKVIDDTNTEKEQKNVNFKTQYVAVNDNPNLGTLDNFNKNVKNRSRQSSKQSSANNSLNNSLSLDWKPYILKTYKIELKSLTDLSNKELLSLLALYSDYYNSNDYLYTNKETKYYNAFRSLNEWFEKENKKGGKQEKLARIERFQIENNLFKLPKTLVENKDFYEFYMNNNSDNAMISKMKEIIAINQTWVNNTDCVEINGIRLYYKVHYPKKRELYQNRLPLLLISEYGQCKEDWLKLPQFLCLNRKIITFDMRGIGQTGVSHSQSLQNNYSIDLLSSDIAGLIEKLGFNQTKIVILGNGILGGIIAQTLTIRFEHLINGLVLVNSLIPNNNALKQNIYLQKYNANYSNFRKRIAELNKNDKSVNYIGCVEACVLRECEESKEGNLCNDESVTEHCYYQTNDDHCVNKSYVMQWNNNVSFPFGAFEALPGIIPSSLCNRPTNGIMAQRNGFIKVLSMKSSNVISSRIGEIKQETLIICGKKDVIIPFDSSQYLHGKLINCNKSLHVLETMGHLWWISHYKQCADLINKFVFRIERDLLTNYDILIESIACVNGNVSEEYMIIITAQSFIADENGQCPERYQISSNNVRNAADVQCKFLCVTSDLGRKEFEIKCVSIDGEVLARETCMLSEEYNVMSSVDIKGFCVVNVKHGWNKYEYQQRLNRNESGTRTHGGGSGTTPGGMSTPNGNDNNNMMDGDNQQSERLESDDFDDYDL